MRVLRLITRLNIGGPARQACFLHADFNGTEDSATLVFGRLDAGEGDFSDRLTHKDRAVYLSSLVRPLNPWRDMLAMLWVLGWLLRHPADIVHTHTAKAGLVGRTAAAMYNILCWLWGRRPVKVVHTYHGHVFSGYFGPGLLKWIKRAERLLWGHSDAIVVLTQSQGDEIRAHLGQPAEKLRVIPLGIDLLAYAGLQRSGFFTTHFNLPTGTRWVGWVGRLVEIKNPGRFVDMAVRLSAILGEDVHFVLVGDGHLRPSVESAIRASGLAGRIHLYGWCNDLVSVYAGLDFFINTSDNEGTPVAALEALAAGVPLALSDVGGCREMLPVVQGAWVYEPDQWQGQLIEWAQAIRSGLRLPLDVRQSIVEKHSQARLAQSLRELYTGLLKT